MNNINQPNILTDYLKENQYDKAVELYELLVEEKPEILEQYWYLGLLYLLQGKEEQAQLTWFIALSQQETDEEIDAKTQELVEILEREAQKQEERQSRQIAWLIRGHIRELQPSNLPNLFNLICLDASWEYPTTTKLRDWGVIELLSDKNTARVPTELLIKTLEKILYIVSDESVDFARACLEHSENNKVVFDTIIEIAKNMVDGRGSISYSDKLVNVCKSVNTNNLLVIKTIFWFYANIKNYQKALESAIDFLDKSTSLSHQIFGQYQLLYLYLRSSNWYDALLVAKDYFKKLIDYVDVQNVDIEDFLAASLLSLCHPLLLIQDQPRINRHIINNLAGLFQRITNSKSNLRSHSYSNTLSKDKPLRIGYIGHTFIYHSVGWLCRWLLHYHNPEKFQCYIYSLTRYTDNLTREWFIKNAIKFSSYNTSLNDIRKAIVEIQEDAIDILVDLDSLTLDITYQIMSFKPAPIQATWLGLDASGIPAIDYFIADPYVLPEDAQDYYSEKIWRLPNTYLAIDGFEVGIPTLKREELNITEDAIIFMNVQGPLKLHPDTLRLQMRIIKNVPNSYLLVKGKEDKNFIQKLYLQLATEEGLNINRLRFLGRTPTELEHRANLSIADVVLDTYPYNGATTTLETLWMEIPLVTRVGEQFAARNSYTFMVNAGITEGIAWTDEEYVEWGIKLGTDEQLRKEVSWKLRQSKKTSPLWNGKQFAREMEKAYQQMWEIYVDSQNSL
jgi:predicted O-linked N-acetylglucosamine transferase (SPINDLY family)